MTTFQFRLATLLKLRENERRQRQIELGQAMEAERIMMGRADGVAAEIVLAKEKVRAASSPGQVMVDSVLELQRYTLQLRAQARTIAEQITQVRAEVERRRLILVEADRQVRILEKLREKQAAAFQFDLQRREQLLLDEMGQKRVRGLISRPGREGM